MNKERKYGFWNWGTGLTIVIVIGVLAFLYMVYLTQQYSNDTVVDNSYDAEVHHNDNLVARTNAKQLSTPITIGSNGNSIIITLPEEMKQDNVKGEVNFTRPSDKMLDINAAFEDTKKGFIVLPAANFHKGKYDVSIKWSQNGKNYESIMEYVHL